MPTTRRLTPRQRLVLDTITRSVKLNGRPPTLRELGEQLSISSTNGVRDHLKALEEKGYIRRDGHSARGIRLVPSRDRHIDTLGRSPLHRNGEGSGVRSVPLLGRVAAGTPLLAEQNLEGHLSLSDAVVASGDFFALRVQGASMRDAGILDGDFVFVRQQQSAQPRDIVVALLDDETTVKRYVPAGDTVRLEAENPAYAPIVVGNADSRLTILGKVCAVLRTI